VRLCEIATKVRVTDGEKHYYYWVSIANPDKAKRAGMKKHRDRMGIGMTLHGQTTASTPLSAEIVPNVGPEPALQMAPAEEH
jgi:hypothetical protein